MLSGTLFDLLQHLTWRPTWTLDQPAHLASARQPGGLVRPCLGECQWWGSRRQSGSWECPQTAPGGPRWQP